MTTLNRHLGIGANLCLALLCFALGQPTVASAPDSDRPWGELAQGSAIAIMRHALAPGFGDPDDFVVDDCTTQRNLSDRGRDQARRIGDVFRQKGIDKATVWSSAWCRCLETARLLDLGEVAQVDALNSFFRQPELGDRRTHALRRLLRERTTNGPLVLVTHQVNITALTDVFPESGEIVFLRLGDDDRVDVTGRFATEP